ncbi:hypothetical protein GJAV_G00197050 [Gymnothorax javanicus]|nr:hypothetical protein GJAV_G00197050 [Gymnothorax javanicus]
MSNILVQCPRCQQGSGKIIDGHRSVCPPCSQTLGWVYQFCWACRRGGPEGGRAAPALSRVRSRPGCTPPCRGAETCSSKVYQHPALFLRHSIDPGRSLLTSRLLTCALKGEHRLPLFPSSTSKQLEESQEAASSSPAPPSARLFPSGSDPAEGSPEEGGPSLELGQLAEEMAFHLQNRVDNSSASAMTGRRHIEDMENVRSHLQTILRTHETPQSLSRGPPY